MCGSTGTSTSSSTTLPTAAAQANYDKLSSLAWNTYNQPYQQYTGEMVAGLSPTEQTGIQNINAAAGLAQPYFAQATTDINQGQAYALPKIDAAYNQVGLGQQLGSQYNQNATNTLNAAYAELTPQVRQQEAAVNTALGQGQNYLTQATNLAGNAAAPVYAQQFNQDALSQYMNPYMNQVVQGTLAPLRQQQQMEQQGLVGNQIMQGAFGGERADLARAALQGQQDIATGNVLGNLLNQGYAQGLGAFQQQQGVNLGAAQANRAALANQANQIAALGQQGFGQGLSAAQAEAALAGQNFGAGSQTAQQLAGIGQQAFSQDVGAAQAQAGLAGQAFGIDQATSQQLAALGTGAQNAALQGAQAQMSSGAVQRGIQQAKDVANQQQFQAAQAFPYQNEQLLANLLLGIGGQSGGTALTSQPTGNMLSSIIGGTLALGQTGLLGSDERFKENMEPVGKTFDGQNIYKYNYKGDDTTRMGLSAQEVEKHNPSAVHKDDKGMRYLNYDDATKHAADKGHFARGGLADSMGGAVHEGLGRANYALRGGVEASYFNEVPYAYQPSGGSQTPLTMADIMPLLNVQKVRTGWDTRPQRQEIKDDSPDITSIIKSATTTPGQRANIKSAFGGLFSPYSPTQQVGLADTAYGSFASGGLVDRKGYAGDDGQSGGVTSAGIASNLDQTLKNLQAPPDPNKPRTLAEMIVGHPLSDEANLGVMAAGLGMLGSKSTNPFVAVGEGAQQGLGTYYNAGRAKQEYETNILGKEVEAQRAAEEAEYKKGLLGIEGGKLDLERLSKQIELGNSFTLEPQVDPVTGEIKEMYRSKMGFLVTPEQMKNSLSSIYSPGSNSAVGMAKNILTPSTETSAPAVGKTPSTAQVSEPTVANQSPNAVQSTPTPQTRPNQETGQPQLKPLSALSDSDLLNSDLGQLRAAALADPSKFDYLPVAERPQTLLNLASYWQSRGDTVKSNSLREAAYKTVDAAISPLIKRQELLTSKSVEQQTQATVLPTGEEIILPVGQSLPPLKPQEAADYRQGMEQAKLGDNGKVVTALPLAPAGGGYPVPDLPPGAKMTKVGEVQKNQAIKDADFSKRVLENPNVVDQGIERFHALATAFKMVESGVVTNKLQFIAAYASALGQPEVSQKLLNGQLNAAEWINKEGVNNTLDQLAAANPRFAQSEFKALRTDGVPNMAIRPESNWELVAEGQGILERQKAAQQDWAQASQGNNAWKSPSAFYDAWSVKNPESAFIESAQRRNGNFKGMELPPHENWVPGAIYIAPSNLSGDAAKALAQVGIKPGMTFRYNGTQKPIEQINPQDLMQMKYRVQ